jgi:hypothetical protein
MGVKYIILHQPYFHELHGNRIQLELSTRYASKKRLFRHVLATA